MHRSRIGVILVDHSEGYDAAETFWARATGGTPQVEDPPEYTSLGTVGTLDLVMQRTGGGTPARVHLDIETDDVPAEVTRLVSLGATVVEERPEGFTVLEDPAGLVLCVISVQTGDRFDAEAVIWD